AGGATPAGRADAPSAGVVGDPARANYLLPTTCPHAGQGGRAPAGPGEAVGDLPLYVRAAPWMAGWPRGPHVLPLPRVVLDDRRADAGRGDGRTRADAPRCGPPG